VVAALVERVAHGAGRVDAEETRPLTPIGSGDRAASIARGVGRVSPAAGRGLLRACVGGAAPVEEEKVGIAQPTMRNDIAHRVSAIRATEAVQTTALEADLTCPRCSKTHTVPVGRSKCPSCELAFRSEIDEEHCENCGYVLYGIDSAVCPECGQPIKRDA